MKPFRNGLLRGRTIALAGTTGPRLREALDSLCARVELLPDGLDDDAIEEWAGSCAPLDVVVYDARDAFAPGALEGLRLAVDEAWSVIRGIATGAMIPAEGPGKIILVSPPPDAGAHAQAARAALQNLVRTLSVEWARHGITAVAIAPGPHTSEEQLATLGCFLASPAGDYLSGCELELGSLSLARA